MRVSPDNKRCWQRLADLYLPLPWFKRWLRHHGLESADADDLTQEILLTIVRELRIEHSGRAGAFRAWLRTITVHRLRGYWRAQAVIPRPGRRRRARRARRPVQRTITDVGPRAR